MLPTMERQIACLYIPSFEIALARAHDTALRNRPVAVAPVHTPRALIREVSSEASAEGLQPGMSVELSRLMCPALRIVPPDSSRVQAAHRELQQRVRPCAPTWESIRPGSLFLDFTGTTRLFGPSIDTATRLGRELTRHQGWDSVIGLAGSKLVSQMAAATLTRPPQVLWIHPGSEPPFLAPLPTMLLPGLSRVSTSLVVQRLEDLNLRTLGALASVSLAQLQTVFGTSATFLHNWALGIDPSPVRPPSAQPMIERTIVLDPDEVDDSLLLGRLSGLLEVVCATLRQQQRVCRRLRLSIRHSDHVERVAQERLPHGTCWEADLQPVLTRLFYRCVRRRVRLTRLTLQVDRLESPVEQLSLFDEPASVPQASHRLSTALDRIRAKFGEHCLRWGNTLQ
jgi:DNA polymerase IV